MSTITDKIAEIRQRCDYIEDLGQSTSPVILRNQVTELLASHRASLNALEAAVNCLSEIDSNNADGQYGALTTATIQQIEQQLK